jgi:D-tyrosyl-tRNA(Tyr) deacylase
VLESDAQATATTVKIERTADTIIIISDPTQNGPESYGLAHANSNHHDGGIELMIALVQRVTRANVSVDGEIVGEIQRGILALVGVRKGDDQSSADRLLERVLAYRIFPDAQDRMNLSLQDVPNGGLLLVPQFTLAADTQKGTRAGFSTAAPPDVARGLFEYLLSRARATQVTVASGIFGANMQVALVNDGPVTFWLETPAPTP